MNVEAKPPGNKGERQLFGTLLASRPARTRSPAALAIAVGLHLVVVVLLVLVSRPFIPRLAHKIFQPISIVLPEEDVSILTIQSEPPAAASPGARRPEDEERRDLGEAMVFAPGPITEIPDPSPGPETAEPSDNGTGGAGAAGSLAERLRPRTVDPRLNPGATFGLPPDASPAAGVRARIAQSIGEYNDSVAAEADARRRALDWTIKSKDGKQWGIGPDGKIHLGDITLPAVAFSPPPGRRDEINNRNRDWAEIERQANQEIGRQSFKDRVKAIRARKEREREDKKKAEATTTDNTN